MRVLLTVAGWALGVVAALATAVVHRDVWRTSVATLPWGLVLGLAAGLLAGLALRRIGGWTAAFGIGWLAVLLLLYAGGPGGDFVFADDAYGWTLLVGGSLLGVVLVLAGLIRPRRVERR